MPHIECSIWLKGVPTQAYIMAKDMEMYPHFMENVLEVRVLTRDPDENSTITQWVTEVEGRKMRWTEKDLFDDRALTITYRQTAGDLKKFEGEWRFLPSGEGALVILTVDFDLGIPMLSALLNPILEKKTRENCEKMLDAIKKHVESSTLVG